MCGSNVNCAAVFVFVAVRRLGQIVSYPRQWNERKGIYLRVLREYIEISRLQNRLLQVNNWVSLLVVCKGEHKLVASALCDVQLAYKKRCVMK